MKNIEFLNLVNLSNNAGSSSSPSLTASGSNVYVTWGDDTSGNNEILFSRATFDYQTNISITLSDSADPVIQGTNFNYVINVSNTGSPTTNVIVTSVLPLSVNTITLPPSCTVSAKIVTCTIPFLNTGSSQILTLTVNPTQTGTITNSASVEHGILDSSLENNVATQKTLIVVVCTPTSPADWTISVPCQLSSNASVGGNVIVQNNSVLVIPSGKTLDINFATKHLLIKSGSQVLIKSGGKIN
jgi:hypothetical protein